MQKKNQLPSSTLIGGWCEEKQRKTNQLGYTKTCQHNADNFLKTFSKFPHFLGLWVGLYYM